MAERHHDAEVLCTVSLEPFPGLAYLNCSGVVNVICSLRNLNGQVTLGIPTLNLHASCWRRNRHAFPS